MQNKQMKNEARSKAVKASKEHKDMMKGKKTKLVPHPTIPKTFIEIIIDEKQ